MVAACNHLKGGKLPTEKLKQQLHKIAMKRTGGEKTDELLGKNGDGPEGLPFSIIVTPDGTEGEVPVTSGNGHVEVGPPEEASVEDEQTVEPEEMNGNEKLTAKAKSKAAGPKKSTGKKKAVSRSAKAKKSTKRRKK